MIVKMNIQNDKNAFVLKGSSGPSPVLLNSWAAHENGSTNGSDDLILTIPTGLKINLTGRDLLLSKQIRKPRSPRLSNLFAEEKISAGEIDL